MAAEHQAEGAGQQQQSRDNDGEKDAVHGTQRGPGVRRIPPKLHMRLAYRLQTIEGIEQAFGLRPEHD
jgi:hypothetical protein